MRCYHIPFLYLARFRRMYNIFQSCSFVAGNFLPFLLFYTNSASFELPISSSMGLERKNRYSAHSVSSYLNGCLGNYYVWYSGTYTPLETPFQKRRYAFSYFHFSFSLVKLFQDLWPRTEFSYSHPALVQIEILGNTH